ncbi:MAG: hypothetical protein A2V84_08445 [Chloroflexi bacterium RBG_16_70_13]|nr:MAG: hypothetical protein A2V84_08445 [Chloroflexi bacterium RBG_16_70_13]
MEEVGMALYGGRPARELTLNDAIMTGFRMSIQVNFIVPILVIGVIINAIVYAAFVPLLVNLVVGDSSGSEVIGGEVIAGIVGALVAGLIGGVLLNLYGQVWATMASVGTAPTIQEAFARVALRWVAILGAGIIVAGVGLGFFIVGGILVALLGGIGFVLFLVAIVASIYIGARLSLAGWLAADGAAAMDAVRKSWEITASKVLMIIGWSIAAGIVFGIVGAILGTVLGIIPLVGTPLATAIGTAFGFGSGVTIYRKVTAEVSAAAPGAPVPGAPSMG